MRIIRPLFLIVAIFTSYPSSAALIEGSFGGVVNHSSYGFVLNGEWTYVTDALVGTNVTGTFSYDTDKVPGLFDLGSGLSNPTTYLQPGNNSWLDISVRLEDSGFVYEVEDQLPDQTAADRIIIRDDDYVSSPPTQMDQFTIDETYSINREISSDIRNHIHNRSYVSIYSFIDEFTDGESPIQEFTLTDFTNYPGRAGDYVFRDIWSHTDSNGSHSMLSGVDFSFHYVLNEFSIAVSNESTSVPEPNSLWLFSAGLIGFGLLKRRRYN